MFEQTRGDRSSCQRAPPSPPMVMGHVPSDVVGIMGTATAIAMAQPRKGLTLRLPCSVIFEARKGGGGCFTGVFKYNESAMESLFSLPWL